MQKKKFYIGSAQFDSDYGITNSNFLNSIEINKIVSYAVKNKIQHIDTSPMYGNSEIIIGKLKHKLSITTKIPKFIGEKDEYASWIESSLFNSLNNLNIEKLDCLLFHDMNDFNKYFCKKCDKTITKFKSLGLIKKIGFSIYDLSELDEGLRGLTPDIVQLPYSIFDRRIEESSLIQKLRISGTEVIARSIFLQGLLANKDFNFKKKFKDKSEIFYLWHRYCEENAIEPFNACIEFIKNSKYIDGFVIGVSSLKEIIQAANAFKKVSTFKPTFEKVYDESLIDPRKWNV